MNTQRKWEITFALLIAIGLMVVMVPDSVLAIGGPSAEDGAESLAEYLCEGSGGVFSVEVYGSGEEGWDVPYECNDGSYGEGYFNCPSCILEQ